MAKHQVPKAPGEGETFLVGFQPRYTIKVSAFSQETHNTLSV